MPLSSGRPMKPKPFSALNHFTVPASSTTMPEDGPFDVVDRKSRNRLSAMAQLAKKAPANYLELSAREKCEIDKALDWDGT
jgi:hypothetical protein